MQEQERLNANARAVLEVLRATMAHPTALEVYEAVRRERPRIGLATVYRVLHQLVEQGRIKELGRDEARYDANIERHDHAICTECGRLLDISLDGWISNEALQAAARSSGIALDTHEIRIYGRCASCQERNRDEYRPGK
jgi:Fur family peroxide stress response transcriptional regulator